MRACLCGKEVADIRLQDGSRQVVERYPIPYKRSAHGTMQLFTRDGEQVRANPAPAATCDGRGYVSHRCPNTA